jgi:transposase
MPSLTKKIINGKPYYYLRECKRVNGKPKIVWTYYLGSTDRLLERLTKPEPSQVAIAEFGGSAAAFDIAATLGVIEIIDRYVPKFGGRGPTVGQYLLVAALNRCVHPCSKSQLREWYGKTVLRRLMPMSAAQLTSQRFWDNMDRVEPEHILAIERELSAKAVSSFGLDLRCLLFDATNFFTFVDSFNKRSSLPQRGHSKEGRDNLRIVGLALLVTADGEVPLFHHTYAGNQHDSVTFNGVIDELADRCRQLSQEACDITLVFDKGNNSEDNLDAVEKGPLHFVGSLIPTHHEDLLAIPRSKMHRLDQKQLPAVWAYRTNKIVFGIKRTVLTTFNRPLFDAQVKTLRREIAKRQRKLEALQQSLKRYRSNPRGKAPTVAGVSKTIDSIRAARHMKDLLKVKVIEGKDKLPLLTFRFDKRAWKTLRNTLLGKTILFTDQDHWTDEQIVLGYRAQFHVEAAFRQMKDPRFLTFRPTFHWTDQKLRVHAFYCVLALMLMSLLRRSLVQKNLPVSFSKMIDALADIREVTLLYPAPPQQKHPYVQVSLSEMNALQKNLFSALSLNRYSVA